MPLNVFDVGDIELQVDELIAKWDAEYQALYNRPIMDTLAGMAVSTAPPEVLAQLPPEAVKKVQGMRNG